MFWRVSRLAPVALCDSRFFRTQVSRTVPVLPTVFNDTNLTGLRPTTRIALKKNPRGAPYPLQLSGGLWTFVQRARVRQFSLAPLPCYHGLTRLRLFTGSTLAGRPGAGFVVPALLLTGTSSISARRPCFHVALTFDAWGDGNGVEGGVTAPGAPMRQSLRHGDATTTLPRQRNYAHAAAAV